MHGLGTGGLGRDGFDWRRIVEQATAGQGGGVQAPLVPVAKFGRNPGELDMLVHVPAGLPVGAPLVVVLHGCQQTAAGYVGATAWAAWADRLGFAVLAPGQRRSNNPNACFSWFEPGDTRRGEGEALSIRQMVGAMIDRHRLDTSRIFVTGLSAGGAMANVMLATYPDVFAAGAIVAGLPYGSAGNVQEAFAAMRGDAARPGPAWGGLVRAASTHRGPWPCVSVWQGTADATVRPANAEAVVAQWLDVHGIAPWAFRDGLVDGQPRRVWQAGDGRIAVEAYTIAGMAHGTPIDTRREDGGTAAPFVLEAGIAATPRILRFWGLGDEAMLAARPRVIRPAAAHVEPERGERPGPAGNVRAIIKKALEDAGLLQR